MTSTTEQPLVSFIIAYYNLPVEMLCLCIDSILRLSLRSAEREIIVIDDGSDTSPMNELMKYGSDIIYVRKKNGGLSSARNKGIDMATGRYLQFVDADDQLIQTPYERCLDIVRYQQDADMVLFDFNEHSPGGDTAHLTDDVAPVSGTDYMRHHNIHGTAWGYLFRKSVLGELRFTPGIYHEDEEFTPLLLLRAERVYPTKVKAYFYNKRPDSIITRKDKSHEEKRHADILYVIRHLHEAKDRLPHNDQLALERRVAQLTMDYIHNTILQSRSLTVTEQRLEALRAYGLFPLPDRDYTTKYKWFRKLTNSRTGLSLLLRLLPLMKKER